MTRSTNHTILAASVALLFLCASNVSQAGQYSVTETLVGGLANYVAFDDDSGNRIFSDAEIELDLEVEIDLPEIRSPSIATNANLAIDVFFSWAPDDGHADPTDVGEETVTFNIPIIIPAGGTQAATTVTESALMSYTEETFAFDKAYGVLLLSLVTSQTITGPFGALGLGISTTVSGDSTVIYDFIEVSEIPEPTSGMIAMVTIIGGILGSRNRGFFRQ